MIEYGIAGSLNMNGGENKMDNEIIIKEYLSGNSIEKITKKYHVGKLKIKNILLENNVTLRKKGKIKQHKVYVVENWKIEKYPLKEGYHYIAKHKSDNFISNDYMNQGGFLTTYIKNNENIEIPSLYDRRKYYMETGNYWWEQWFDIVLEKDLETKKCPYCDWKTNDIDNKSGAFEVHLREAHNISLKDYLCEYPEDENYFSVFTAKQKKLEKYKNADNFIVCPICGEKLEKMTYWHLKNKHNMSMIEFRKEYPDSPVISLNMLKQTMKAKELSNLTVSKDRFISHYEHELHDFLDKYQISYETNRQILIGQELDILIEEKKIAIEFNGLKWHTEWFGKKKHDYHLNKTIKCNEKGYGLIHIFEDEYVSHKDVVYSKLSHILGLDYNLPRIMGRKCVIKQIYKYEAQEFLNKYHIQGFVSASVYYGAFYESNLVAVMSFKNGNLKNPDWELVRFASDYHYRFQGVGDKLFKHFIKEYDPQRVVSFADRRWTLNPNRNLYTALKFKLDGYTRPDYRYFIDESKDDKKYQRIHKMLFNKQKLSKKYGFPLTMTETEMAKELGYDRIWDCGLIRYVWEKEG